mmetsp:Transcript_42266/g.100788  ORF Transcript_42266/g.100788 Transcript_42266/m.100788 type:complete len:563 (+) Transcript_42266:1564-3252(+)
MRSEGIVHQHGRNALLGAADVGLGAAGNAEAHAGVAHAGHLGPGQFHMSRIGQDVVLLRLGLAQDPLAVAAPGDGAVHRRHVAGEVQGLLRRQPFLEVENIIPEKVWSHGAIQTTLVPGAGVHLHAHSLGSAVGHLGHGRHSVAGRHGGVHVALAGGAGPLEAGAVGVLAAALAALHLRRGPGVGRRGVPETLRDPAHIVQDVDREAGHHRAQGLVGEGAEDRAGEAHLLPCAPGAGEGVEDRRHGPGGRDEDLAIRADLQQAVALQQPCAQQLVVGPAQAVRGSARHVEVRWLQQALSGGHHRLQHRQLLPQRHRDPGRLVAQRGPGLRPQRHHLSCPLLPFHRAHRHVLCRDHANTPSLPGHGDVLSANSPGRSARAAGEVPRRSVHHQPRRGRRTGHLEVLPSARGLHRLEGGRGAFREQQQRHPVREPVHGHPHRRLEGDPRRLVRRHGALQAEGLLWRRAHAGDNPRGSIHGEIVVRQLTALVQGVALRGAWGGRQGHRAAQRPVLHLVAKGRGRHVATPALAAGLVAAEALHLDVVAVVCPKLRTGQPLAAHPPGN